MGDEFITRRKKMKTEFVILFILIIFGYVFSDSKEEFDPVEEMKKLWEAEIQEGEAFKQELRDDGVNVEEWEEKLNNLVDEIQIEKNNDDNVKKEKNNFSTPTHDEM